MKMKTRSLFFLGMVSFLSMGSVVLGQTSPKPYVSLKEALSSMKSVYAATYAPAAWKEQFAGYSLEAEYTRAMERAEELGEKLTIADSRKILKDFIYAMKDYHVSIRFHSTEMASLPFTVRGAEGRYFLAYIDRSKLPAGYFPFNVGDEVLTWGGQSIQEAIDAVKAEVTPNVEGTDQALAELGLTLRRASRGYSVPRGAITIGIKPMRGNDVKTHQLVWEYRAEKITPQVNSLEPLHTDSVFERIASQKMIAFEDYIDKESTNDLNPQGLGVRESFLPALGNKIWETASDSPFEAYLFMNDFRKLIGVVRIPSYVPGDTNRAVAAFAEIIAKFESVADGMVIDQLNNPGGSVFYLYALASMLTPRPLKTPQHSMSITQGEIIDALEILSALEKVTDDASAKRTLGFTIAGYPVTYQFALFMKEYASTLVSEWEAGKTLTRPFWIYGVDQIHPAHVHFTKPILFLTNELDFSGGDFMPAILQDNKRVKVFGSRTAGAGGYVEEFQFPNLLGVEAARVTRSIAKRVEDNPIENLGVTPDVVYEMTAKDLRTAYGPYRTKVLETISGMIAD